MAIVRFIVSILMVTSIAMGVTLNLQGGINRSTIEFDLGDSFFSSYDAAPQPGPLFLFGVDYLDRGEFNLSSNIGVFHAAGTFAHNFFKGTIYYDEGLTYLTMNSTVDYKFLRWNRIKPFLSVGPRVDIIVHNDPFFDQLPQFNKYALGLNYGGGVKYVIDPLVVGFRYDYYQNFTGIGRWSTSDKYESGEVEGSTMVFSLVLGYML